MAIHFSDSLEKGLAKKASERYKCQVLGIDVQRNYEYGCHSDIELV